MQRIEVIIRPNGRDGYQVGWCAKHGDIVTSPPVFIATFEATPEGRREATMFKNGIIQGMRIAGNLIEGMLQS